jgi:hypothetical protein
VTGNVSRLCSVVKLIFFINLQPLLTDETVEFCPTSLVCSDGTRQRKYRNRYPIVEILNEITANIAAAYAEPGQWEESEAL